MAAGVVDKLVLQVTGAVDSAARGMPALLMAVGKAATVAAGAIAGVTLAAARYADVAAKTSDRLGIDVEEYSALAVAADLADVSISGLISSSQSYARQLEAAASGSERQAEAFRRLGIDAGEALESNQSFADVLPTLIDRLGDIESPALRAATAQQVLGRGARELAPMIRAGSEGLREARRVTEEWGLSMRRETTDQAERLNDALSLMGARARGMAIAFGLRLVPAALRAVEALSGVVDALRPRLMHLVDRAAAGLATALDALVSPAGAAATAILALGAAMTVAQAGGISGMLSRLPLVGTALGGMTTAAWAAVAPMLPLALAIGAVVLAVDDLFAFMRGGDSIIGRFAESLGVESELYQALSAFGDVISSGWDLLKALVFGIDDLVLGALDALAERFDFLAGPIQTVRDLFQWMIDSLPSLGGILDAIAVGGRRVAVGLDRATRIVEGEEGVPIDDVSIAREAGERLVQAERERVEIRGVSQSTVQNVQVQVDGARDPAAVAREVQRVLQSQYRTAAGQVGG